MSHHMVRRTVAIACAGLLCACTAPPTSTPVSYLGEPEPGLEPTRFAPDRVSTEAIELNGVFTPDFGEFFFTRLMDGTDIIHHSVRQGSQWTQPQPLLLFPEQARAVAVDMTVSPDGQELYFLGRHPHRYAPENPSLDLWVSRRAAGRWAEAQVVPPPVSTAANELYPVVVADGSLYFTSNREGALGTGSLYRAQRLPGGGFAEPVMIPPPISTEHGIGDTFVSPDESLMVFSSRRPPSFGNGDLFISLRLRNGDWGEPVNLGDRINTGEHEFCPMLTPDGKFLFFSRLYGGTWDTATGGDVFWVDAGILEQFRR